MFSAARTILGRPLPAPLMTADPVRSALLQIALIIGLNCAQTRVI